MQKTIPIICLFLLLTVAGVRAEISSDLVILDKEAVAKLSDEKVKDAYTEVLVELEAIRLFHTTSGFSPKQYEQYKKFLKYRYELLMEIHDRNIELPSQMER